jgi:plastocyanin
MNIGRTSIIVGAVLAAAVAIPTIGRADDGDQNEPQAVKDAVVQFGQPQPQTPPAAVTHFLDPDDVTIVKGGTVTFVVNGGGHGIAIHEVDEDTTRDDIADDLCQGGANEADRAGRAQVCNGTVATGVTNPNTGALVIGTQNLKYEITDGDDDLVIDTGFNPPNPRVDDPTHSHRLLATSGRIPGVADSPTAAPPASGNPAGAFLVGTAPAVAPATGFVPGNRIQVTFEETGRFLVICMNRGHSLNDHMFGFVNVVDDDEDEDDDDDNSGHGGHN